MKTIEQLKEQVKITGDQISQADLEIKRLHEAALAELAEAERAQAKRDAAEIVETIKQFESVCAVAAREASRQLVAIEKTIENVMDKHTEFVKKVSVTERMRIQTSNRDFQYIYDMYNLFRKHRELWKALADLDRRTRPQ